MHIDDVLLSQGFRADFRRPRRVPVPGVKEQAHVARADGFAKLEHPLEGVDELGKVSRAGAS